MENKDKNDKGKMGEDTGHSHKNPQPTGRETIKDNLFHEHWQEEKDKEINFELDVEGVRFVVYDDCKWLNIQGKEARLEYSLENCCKPGKEGTLEEEGDYYIRNYQIKLLKHKTNEKDQRLFINQKEIPIVYNPATQLFYQPDSLKGYNSLLEIVKDYLHNNPDLKEKKHHH
jgi:hypothetical protein